MRDDSSGAKRNFPIPFRLLYLYLSLGKDREKKNEKEKEKRHAYYLDLQFPSFFLASFRHLLILFDFLVLLSSQLGNELETISDTRCWANHK